MGVISIIVSVVGWVGSLISLLSRRAQQKRGAVAQAQKEISQAAKVEAAIANAEANAPRDVDDVIAREKAGTF
jgi:hypothetical protein